MATKLLLKLPGLITRNTITCSAYRPPRSGGPWIGRVSRYWLHGAGSGSPVTVRRSGTTTRSGFGRIDDVARCRRVFTGQATLLSSTVECGQIAHSAPP